MSKAAKVIAGIVALAAAAVGFAWMDLSAKIAPLPAVGEVHYVRVNSGDSVATVFDRLEKEGILRDSGAALFYSKLRRLNATAREGTFEFKGSDTIENVVKILRKPMVRMVRIPEGWWIKRVAERLEREQVCEAKEYIELAAQPERFKDAVGFTLPSDSLEGYLFPDTYDLPPLLGAERVIRMQLRAFEQKAAGKIDPAKLNRTVVIASLIEKEAALDVERPVVAGVIENRLEKGMPLELDATVLYALQEWKALGPGVVRTVKSPYNTYLNEGLPPGPIGSPSAASIMAALNPKEHDKLFYVARPDRTHIFTRTYPEHLAAIRKARAEWREFRREQGQDASSLPPALGGPSVRQGGSR